MKNIILNCFLFAICLAIILSTNYPALANSDRSAETDKYIEMIGSASFKTRVDAAKLITRSGNTDPRLYSFINEKLLNEYNINSTNPDHVDEMSWMCKALAASGSANYAPTLEKIIQTASSDKLQRYAKQSLDLIPENAKKNKSMNNTENIDPNLSPEINKYINMLQSDNAELKRDAAKSIHRGHFSEKALFDVLNKALLKDYKLTSSNDPKLTDALSWMCKALATSGMPEYKQTLEEIIKNTSDLKLKKYAEQSLGMIK